jgi:hypothetical protein
VEATTGSGTLPPDLGGVADTQAVTDAVVKHIEQ